MRRRLRSRPGFERARGLRGSVEGYRARGEDCMNHGIFFWSILRGVTLTNFGKDCGQRCSTAALSL